jgi:DNA-binding HxlR family transcriptional regulator
MAIPRPGRKVRGSQTGSPINALFDLLGRRWALGVLWNLDVPRSFRDLQSLCGDISPSILNARLKDLREAEILERSPEGYRLTARGWGLRQIIVPLGQWSAIWSEEVFHFIKPGMKEKVFKEPPAQGRDAVVQRPAEG